MKGRQLRVLSENRGDAKGARPTIGGKRTPLLNGIPSAYDRWEPSNATHWGLWALTLQRF
jgi:hypothetical protein